MDGSSRAEHVKQVAIVVVIVVGVTLNTILLKGAGDSSDILTMKETIDLHKVQMDRSIRQNLEYLEQRISKAEARQDAFYNDLNRRVDMVENRFSRITENNLAAKTTINNTFNPTQTTVINQQKEEDLKSSK